MINIDNLITLLNKMAVTEYRVSEYFDTQNNHDMAIKCKTAMRVYTNVANILNSDKLFNELCEIYEVNSDEEMAN